MGRKERPDANIHQKKLDLKLGEGGYKLKVNMNRGLALVLVILLIPVYMVIAILVMVLTGRPIFFVQKRVGYKGRVFKMFKFRTMVVGAEEMQKKLLKKNEADGLVFKIRDDPRFTKIGKILSHSGLDELPQLLNVVMGDMEMVGPRPLPVNEAIQIPIKYRKIRESIRPGIISPWIFNGYHSLGFEEWMKMDRDYVINKKWWSDGWLIVQGVWLLLRLIIDIFLSN